MCFDISQIEKCGYSEKAQAIFSTTDLI